MRTFVHRFAFAALLAGGTAAIAAPVQLAGLAPYTVALNGVQSDSGAPPPYAQAFSAAAGSTLDMIVWWGYRLNDASGGAADNFTVTLSGVTQSGALSVAADGLLQRYTLDITDALLTGSSLEISNDGAFEWFWQGIDATPYDGVSPFPVSFSLLGTTALTVPEPGSLALVGLAGLAALAARRRRS